MGYRDMIYEQNFWKKIYRILWTYWNAFEVSNVSLFLDLSANYNVFFWHDLWNDAWIGWMVFCYENILFEMLWWSMIEYIDFMLHYIDWFRYYMIIYFIIKIRIWNMIYEELWYKKHYELTTWLCKGPCQWGHIRWQLICPEGSYRQRDQRQTAKETSDSEGLCWQMIHSSPQKDTRCYDPTIEKIWS